MMLICYLMRYTIGYSNSPVYTMNLFSSRKIHEKPENVMDCFLWRLYYCNSAAAVVSANSQVFLGFYCQRVTIVLLPVSVARPIFSKLTGNDAAK